MLEHVTIIGDHSQDSFTIDHSKEALVIVRYEYWPDDDIDAQGSHYEELIDVIMDKGAEVVAQF